MQHQAGFALKPFGTLNAVPFTKAGQVLGSLGVLVLRQVFWRQQVGFDLVEVTRVAPSLGERALVCDTHLDGGKKNVDSSSLRNFRCEGALSRAAARWLSARLGHGDDVLVGERSSQPEDVAESQPWAKFWRGLSLSSLEACTAVAGGPGTPYIERYIFVPEPCEPEYPFHCIHAWVPTYT